MMLIYFNGIVALTFLGLVHSYAVPTTAPSTTFPVFGNKKEAGTLQNSVNKEAGGHLTNQVVCLPEVVSSDTIASLQFDIQALKRMGFGSSAGIASKHDKNNTRRNVHQIWLQSPAGQPPEYFAGNMDVRKDVMKYLDSIRQYLSKDETEPLPRDLVELSYLWYDRGGSYMRHVDSFSNSESKDFRRAVSLILFLGDPTDDRTWDPQNDGGALRIYSKDTAGKETHEDVTPTPGTLVLFSSSGTPHEVLETHRTRACIVGWFNTPVRTGNLLKQGS